MINYIDNMLVLSIETGQNIFTSYLAGSSRRKKVATLIIINNVCTDAKVLWCPIEILIVLSIIDRS